MNIILIPILQAIVSILNFYQLIIFVSIIFSWLFAFGIIDGYKHKILTNIYMFLRAVTEPLYAFVRRFLPPFGPMDFSPVVIILAIYILSAILNRVIIQLSISSTF